MISVFLVVARIHNEMSVREGRVRRADSDAEYVSSSWKD